MQITRRPKRKGEAVDEASYERPAQAGGHGQELHLWLRDPVRLSCLVIALIVGAGTGVLPRLTAGTGLLLPFAGTITVVIAAACACNQYDSSMWLTVMTPRSARADIRGRQAAWLIVVGPYAVACTVILTAVSGQPQACPGRSDCWPRSWAAAPGCRRSAR